MIVVLAIVLFTSTPLGRSLIAAATVAAALLTLWSLFAKVIPAIRRFVHFLDDISGEAARPGIEKRPGIMERLEAIEKSSAAAQQNTQPNGGSSPHDILIRRLESVDEKLCSAIREAAAHRREAQIWHRQFTEDAAKEGFAVAEWPTLPEENR